MNGKKSIDSYWREKEKNLKKRYLIYLTSSLFITNSILFIILPQNKELNCTIQSDWKKLNNPSNKKFVLRTENFIDYEDVSQPLPITILNENKRIIVKKAWLHKTSKENETSDNSYLSYIEIKKSDLLKFVSKETNKFKIFPFSLEFESRKVKKGESYELIF